MLGKIKDARGYTSEQALWGDSWINLLMEAADAPRYVKGRKAAQVAETKEDLEKITGRKSLLDSKT